MDKKVILRNFGVLTIAAGICFGIPFGFLKLSESTSKSSAPAPECKNSNEERKVMTNEEIITETKKCNDAGMDAVGMSPGGNTEYTRIQCVPVSIVKG